MKPKIYKVFTLSQGCPKHFLILTETRRKYHRPHFTDKEAKVVKRLAPLIGLGRVETRDLKLKAVCPPDFRDLVGEGTEPHLRPAQDEVGNLGCLTLNKTL